ncbi:denticleless protein homolog isoform X2 [Carica papaya]|nr:denticleless protein homolog isoform X2 [Carica papaya]
MEIPKARSLFKDVRSRELNGFPGFSARKRPYSPDLVEGCYEIGAVAVEHEGYDTPPLAVSFCNTSKNSHIFAVSDEDGFMSLFDSRKKFHCRATYEENTERARISEWLAHSNAIFDVCWIKEDNSVLTASGDQTIKVWDVEKKKCTSLLTGHSGSVKSLYSHPTNSDIFVSGSRDGSFAVWDLRHKQSSGNRRGSCTPLTAMVKGAHLSPQAKRVRGLKAASMSITSVLYLKDEVSLATAGAVDSIIKFWDVRNLKAPVTQASPHPQASSDKGRLHGISCLSQDSTGVFLTASCMDNTIYLYNVLQLDKGPTQSFFGCRIASFYVKSVISPDAAHILSGSSDGYGCIWQLNRPKAHPIILKSHDGEVTAVAWCPTDSDKLATASDDYTVRAWNLRSSYCPRSRSPPSFRRRIAIPSTECKRVLVNEEPVDATKDPGSSHSSDNIFTQNSLSSPTAMPVIGTPEAQRKKLAVPSDSTEI